MSARLRWLLRRMLAAPLVHFLALGAALYVLKSSAVRWAEVPPPVIVTAADVALRREEWTLKHGRPPNTRGMAALEEELLDDAVLRRLALDLGVDRNDPMVRRRLAYLASFVGEDAEDEATLERAARKLGLERGDVLIRRHLTQLGRLAAGRLGPDDMPTEAELAAHLARYAERFVAPPRITLTHVYLAADRRGAMLVPEATALLAVLRRDGVRPRDVAALGDPFIRGSMLTASRAELERTLGATFAAAIWEGPTRTWFGPVPSSYGVHLVWIENRTAAETPPLASVRSRVLHEVLRERAAARRADRLRVLRARYAARVEGVDEGPEGAATATEAPHGTPRLMPENR